MRARSQNATATPVPTTRTVIVASSKGVMGAVWPRFLAVVNHRLTCHDADVVAPDSIDVPPE